MEKTLLFFILNLLIIKSQAQNGFYKHLKGTIGKQPITMDLTKTDKGLASDVLVIGAYSYDNAEGLLMIEGGEKGDSLVFIEKDNIKETGYFALKQVNSSSFVGIWTNQGTKEVLKVVLNEVYTEGTIRFDYVAFRDSVEIGRAHV